MIYKFCLHLFFICALPFVYCQEQWEREEKEIFLTAQLENLPVIAFFLGGEWCPWSEKLSQEVLKNPLFLEGVGNAAILWEIALEKEIQDDAIRQKYQITACPQILLLDPRGKEFARLCPVSLKASEYAQALVSLIDDFQEICSVLDEKKMEFEEERWKELFLKAKKLSAACYKQVILERGLKKEKGTFFHLEKLASLLEKHKLKHKEVLKIKQQLLKRDPENRWGTHFKIAVLEFQKLSWHLKKKGRQEKALKPLLEFVRRFGKKDKENCWRAEMMIADFLFAKNAIPLALEHAKKALEAAPESALCQIQEAVAFMQRDL